MCNRQRLEAAGSQPMINPAPVSIYLGSDNIYLYIWGIFVYLGSDEKLFSFRLRPSS
jgi:hypothetical protein